MNHKMKFVLSLFICYCLTMPHLVFSQDANETIEPTVEGAGTINLLEGGTLYAWKVPSAHWSLNKGNIVVGYTGPKKLKTLSGCTPNKGLVISSSPVN